MRTRPLAAYALDRFRELKSRETQTPKIPNRTISHKQILAEIEYGLGLIHENKIQAEIDDWGIDRKMRSIVVVAHLGLSSTKRNINLAESLISESQQLQRLQDLAKAEKFINLVPVVRTSLSGTHIVVELHFIVPKQLSK